MAKTEKLASHKEKISNFFLAIFLIFLFSILLADEGNPEFHLSIAANQGSCPAFIERFAVAMLDNDLQVTETMDFDVNSEIGYLSSSLSYLGVATPEEVVWAHAVNNKFLLKNAVNSCAHFIEADIVENRVAHHPNDPSNLSVESLIRAVNNSGQGLKLDFKDVESIQSALDRLIEYNFSGPVFLNLGVLPGPGSSKILSPAEVQTFTQQISRYPDAVISLSWFTGKNKTGFYNMAMIDQMTDFIRENDLADRELTFAIDLFYLEDSYPALEELLTRFPDSTLSIYYNGNGTGQRARRAIAALSEPPFAGRVFLDFY